MNSMTREQEKLYDIQRVINDAKKGRVGDQLALNLIAKIIEADYKNQPMDAEINYDN